MTPLARWMKKNSRDDAWLAEKALIDRSQVSRLRRGKSFASLATAERFERITGLPWHSFIGRFSPPRTRKTLIEARP